MKWRNHHETLIFCFILLHLRYHQLTQTLLEYLVSPPFTQPSAAAELKSFFEGFIKGFEAKFDKVRWARS